MPILDQKSIDPSVALHGVPHGVLIVDGQNLERPIRYVNEAFVRLTGFEAKLVLGRSLLLLTGTDSDPVLVQQLREAMSLGKAFSGELVLHCRDDRPLWTRISLQPMRAACGALVQIVATIEDVSKYKRSRESVRVSEARLELAMEASGLSMWDWDIVRDQVSYNEQWRHSLGIDPREFLTRKSLSGRLLLPTEDAAIMAQFERHMNGETTHFECEYPLSTASGEQKWFRARARIVSRDANGRARRMVGVLRDITEHRQNAEDAFENERRWRRAVHGTCDGLYDWDLLTGHVWYAERFREIVGYSQADFPDTFQALQNILHPDDRSLVLSRVRSHLENRQPFDVRCRIKTQRDASLWCRLRGQAERDAAGRPVRLAGSISDISAQIEAEEALSRSQDFYGTILDSMPLYIAYADRDECVVYANRLFQEFFDVPIATSRGRPIADVVGERRYAAIGSHVRQALEGRTVEGQGKFRDHTGRALDIDASFVPHRDEAGSVIGCFVVARDMTERRLLEAELRQSQKMEAVGRLTGGIAHDFNNLLSVIVGNVQLLARSLRESPRLLRQSETALKAAMRGADLTRRLLAFARQQVLEPRVVDLNSLLAGMYELLRRTLTGDIEIRQRLDADTWPTKVDGGQLENAILNLVINARDAMPDGGVITVVTRNATIAAERGLREEGLSPGDYAVIEVTDTGTGMSAETLKRVFEPFFTTKDVGKGSGLGLPMVYGFVKQSGGHVVLASTPASGTTAYLYFPRSHAAIETVAPERPIPVELPRGNETILVVEDNAEVRATAIDILTGLGYRVLEAANGHQALEQFIRHAEISLVFSDVMLPGGLHGTQLVRKLRERRPNLRVLMTSGFSESSIVTRGMLDGSTEVLPKPYKVEDLARRVRAKLDESEESKRVPA